MPATINIFVTRYNATIQLLITAILSASLLSEDAFSPSAFDHNLHMMNPMLLVLDDGVEPSFDDYRSSVLPLN